MWQLRILCYSSESLVPQVLPAVRPKVTDRREEIPLGECPWYATEQREGVPVVRSFNKVQREFIFYVWLLAKSRAVMYFKKVLPIMMLEERNGGKTEFS
jgi:hypothetical protein